MINELSERLETLQKELEKEMLLLESCNYDCVGCSTCKKIRNLMKEIRSLKIKLEETDEEAIWKEIKAQIKELNALTKMHDTQMTKIINPQTMLKLAYQHAINAAAGLEKLINMRGQAHE